MIGPELYDTHCHLDFVEFEGRQEALLESCRRASVTKLIIPSIDRGSWEGVQGLSLGHPQLSYALGLHPLFIARHSLGDISRLDACLSQRPEGLVAVGEIGLDVTAADMALQYSLFEAQLALASDHGMPVIMHARKTHSQILSALKKFPGKGVIHAFSGGKDLLDQYVAKGISIGVGCVITWPSATRTRSAVATAPLGSLLLETDSPDMRVSGLRREFGCPSDIRQVFSALCNIRSESPEILAAALRDNAEEIFYAGQ